MRLGAVLTGMGLGLALCAALPSRPQGATTNSAPGDMAGQVQALNESLDYLEQHIARKLDDLAWFSRLSDIARVDKVRFAGPPPRLTGGPPPESTNEVVVSGYTFLPLKPAIGKLPLLVFVHGGVHGRFAVDSYLHIIRELVEQGYAIIAPDYRGSEGYGGDYFRLIDYGGLENEDVWAARNWMLEQHPNIDSGRIGIIGWSHGGMIALMNLFLHPGGYAAGYAGVPVSDLVTRMGYKGQGYQQLFSAPYHLGQTADQNVDEYRRRSPVFHVDKLETPLLIHTTTNDEDVHVMEVEHLIQALKAAGKSFQSRVYTNAPGGHAFNRLDTRFARESRLEIYRFLGQHLRPPNPLK